MKDYLKEIKDRLERATPGPYQIVKHFNGPVGIDKEGNKFQICEFNRNMENWVHDEYLYLRAPSDLAKLVKAVEVYEELTTKLTTTEYLAYTNGSSASDHQYKMGATDGHRLTAEWAREAQQKAKEIMGGSGETKAE